MFFQQRIWKRESVTSLHRARFVMRNVFFMCSDVTESLFLLKVSNRACSILFDVAFFCYLTLTL